jgi:hypothetical protein
MRAEPAHETLRRIARSRPHEGVRAPAPPTAAARLLALQRTAGNRVVSRMLAQRQATAPTQADTKNDAVTATIIMDERIGVLPLLNFAKEKDAEVHVTVPSTDRDPDLFRYSAQGKKLDHVKISTQTFQLVLDDVYITSIQSSGSGPEAYVSMTLSSVEGKS